MNLKPASIYGRILSLSVGSVLLAALVFAILFIFITWQALRTHIHTKIEHSLGKLGHILSVPLINQDYVQIVNIIDEESKGGDIRFIWLTGQDGRVMVCNDEKQLLAPIAPFYRKMDGFRQKGMTDGWSLAAIPNYGIMNSILALVAPWSLLILIVVVAASTYLFIRLIKNITVPLSHAIQASAGMAGGNFLLELTDSGILEIDTLNRSLVDTGRKLDELTLRLRTERDELEHNREEIRNLSEFRESIIDNATVWLNVLDQDARVLVWNKAAEDISGYSREEVIGNDDIWQLLYPDAEYRNQIFSKAADIIHKGMVVEDLVTVIRTKTGVSRTISWYSKNLKSAAGVTMGSIALGIDITEKKRVEESLRQAQKMETVGALAGGIAHDFNNVLMGIVGAISLVEFELDRKEGISKEAVHRYLTTMRNAAERASDVVRHLLAISRKQELELTVVDLNLAVRNISKICRSSFDKSIKIKAGDNSRPAAALADLTQIEQVLLNLCINAAHAMTIMRPEGQKWGGLLTIAVEAADDSQAGPATGTSMEKYWKLSVSDTGVGMAMDILQNIFDPFFTTKEKGVGTGLGLSMTYSIVQAHNGFIRVYSEPGQGSVFNLFLPMAEEDAAGEAKVGVHEIAMGSGLILFVDDENINRELARVMLEGCGYEVVLAEDGEHAVKLYAELSGKIRAVILDIVMPKMSGDEACARILAMDPQARIIISSGFCEDTRVKRALASGAKLFVPKPYSLKGLSSAVKSALE